MEPLTLSLDSGLRLAVTLAFLGWNILEGAVFENTYPRPMVELYKVPLWRVVLLLLLLASADWCPSVAVMVAFFIFFYIMDMEVTNEKWSPKELKRSSGD